MLDATSLYVVFTINLSDLIAYISGGKTILILSIRFKHTQSPIIQMYMKSRHSHWLHDILV